MYSVLCVRPALDTWYSAGSGGPKDPRFLWSKSGAGERGRDCLALVTRVHVRSASELA